MLKAIPFLALVYLLSSCGGITRYYHHDIPTQPGVKLAPVTIQVGQTVKLLKHTHGIIPLGGGYIEGVTIEDPSVVSVKYGKDGSDLFDPFVYITGRKPGSTRAVYCNRIGKHPNFSRTLDTNFQRESFQIIVK